MDATNARAGHRGALGRRPLAIIIVMLLGFAFGCGRGAGGWRDKSLSSQTIDWRTVSGQRLLDVLATPSIAPRRVDLLLCRWNIEAPIRVGWPADATASQLEAFEKARAAWSEVVPGLVLETTSREEAQILLDFVEADDPRAPTGTADTVADCNVDAGHLAVSDEEMRGRIAFASILMRRENVSWAGATSPMSDDEFFAAVLHELGHALGISGHAGGRASVMTADRDRVKRAGRRVAKGEALKEPTLRALYTVPIGANVGAVAFVRELRPALDGLANLAEREGWAGPFGRAGGGAAEVFWRTPDGRFPSVYTHEWASGIRGKRELDWRLSLGARAALERLD